VTQLGGINSVFIPVLITNKPAYRKLHNKESLSLWFKNLFILVLHTLLIHYNLVQGLDPQEV